MSVEPQWIDYNGHLNMAYYNVLFDRASDVAFEALGMGPDYAATQKYTIYIAETHLTYQRELSVDERVICSFQILDHDEKRIHAIMQMHHEDGWLAATLEGLWLHIKMTDDNTPEPYVAPFPNQIAAKLDAMADAHRVLKRPKQAGRAIGIKRKVAPS